MIDFIIRSGQVLQIAPHEGCTGFCAAITCTFTALGSLEWNEVGHGHTIEQAKTKANGQLPCPEYKMEHFQ